MRYIEYQGWHYRVSDVADMSNRWTITIVKPNGTRLVMGYRPIDIVDEYQFELNRPAPNLDVVSSRHSLYDQFARDKIDSLKG